MASAKPMVVPYVVPSSYPLGEKGWSRPLGHGVHAVLSVHQGALISPLRPDSLDELGLESLEAAWPLAQKNIDAVFKNPVKAQLFPSESPEVVDLILLGNSWLAASCIMVSKLYELAASKMPSKPTRLLVSIPNPEALLIFPLGTTKQRAVMRQRIREAEAEHRKPTTWELFELTATGIQPFTE